MVMLLGVTDIVILLYRTTHPRIYLRITKTVKTDIQRKTTIPRRYNYTGNILYHRIVETSIHWNY